MNSARLLTRRVFVAAALLAAMGVTSSASAEPRLIGQISPSASRMSLRFSERLIVRRSFVVIKDQDGNRKRVRITFSADARTMFVEPTPRLPSGVYSVEWTALGQRGLPVRGSFDLTIP